MKNNRGGKRPNSGRPKKEQTYRINARLTQINLDFWNQIKNKTKFLNELLDLERQK